MNRILLAASAIVLSCGVAGPASALTMQECSAKYKAAQQANTLNGQKWNDFRKANCGADAAPAAATAPAPKDAAKPAPANTTAAAKPTAPAGGGAAVFPKAVDPKYSSESAGKARMKTCVDQYKANKANGGNADLKWIEKGGGYYSECNKRLKS